MCQQWTNPSDSIFQRTLTKIWCFRFLSSLGWGIKNGTSLYAPLSSTFWWALYIGTSIKQKVKGLAKCVRYDKVSLNQASFSYFWFATTWQGSRVVGQYNIKFFLKNLHENGQHGYHDATHKPAIERQTYHVNNKQLTTVL